MIEISIAIAGMAGGFVKSLVEQKGRVILPKTEEVKDEKGEITKYVHLGALANMALGAIVAFYTAIEPSAAFTAGVTAVFIVEKLFERTPITNR